MISSVWLGCLLGLVLGSPSVAAQSNCNSDSSSIFSLQGIEPSSTVEDACVSYSTLDRLSNDLAPALNSITQSTDFFSYYRLNLFHKTCPFWSDSTSMCGNIACAVATIDNESDIPEIWRAEELGKLEGPMADHPGRSLQEARPSASPLMGSLGEKVGESCVFEYDDECDDRDYCLPEDERASAKGEYVSLVDNPERFTGYKGPGARQVWEAIYRENCFSKTKTQAVPVSQVGPFGSQASSDLKHLIEVSNQQQAMARQVDGKLFEEAPFILDDECLEKRVFYRVISGMHASISTHLCWDHLNQTTGEWGPNLACYQERLQHHPERVANLYFNYALVLKAVGKLNDYIKSYTFCSGDAQQDRITKQKVLALTEHVASEVPIFDESLMFKDPGAGIELKEDFRNRFRNVSRMMDCVGCDKCRLWGKLQTVGYGTALKVLLESEDAAKHGEKLQIKRTELVALFNTLQKISNSLKYIRNFEDIAQGKHASYSADGSKISSRKDRKSGVWVEPPANMRTPSNSFKEEWDRVWQVWWFVMRSWFAVPGVIWEISVLELARLWDLFIGLPVRPRTWTFERFSFDEL